MKPGIKKVQQRAQELANRRMQDEILPLLASKHPNPRGWNPLVSRPIASPYGLKLRMPDMLVSEILKSDPLMTQTEQIVLDSVRDAALDEAKTFVTDLLSSLMSDG